MRREREQISSASANSPTSVREPARESGFAAGWGVSVPGAGTVLPDALAGEDAARGLSCEAQPQENRNAGIARAWVRREGRVSMSSCLLGSRPRPSSRERRELMLLGRYSRRPLDLFPLLGVEKI